MDELIVWRGSEAARALEMLALMVVSAAKTIRLVTARDANTFSICR